jgi:hypothetical protein
MLESEALRDLPGSLAEAARYYWLSALQGFALALFWKAYLPIENTLNGKRPRIGP